MITINVPFVEIVGYKVVLFVLSVLIFTRLYLNSHSPDIVNAFHRAVMIQTLTGTTEPQTNYLKIVETIQAFVAFAMIAGFFTIVFSRKTLL